MKKILLISLVMALFGTACGLFLAFKLSQRYTSSEPAWETIIRMAVDPRSLFPDRDVLNVLVLGTDYNYTEKDIVYTKNVRSDTIILCRLNLKTQQAKLLSVPRDTRVNIPGDGFDRINSAFALGGAKLTETVVQNLAGVPIDYYVRIKEQALKNLVDAIGGIDIEVEKNMDYDDRWGHLHIHLKKGFQHLSGDKAAQYARFRHDEEGDYGRILRQQKVIKAVQKRMAEPGVLTNLEKVVKVARENIDTDLKFPEILALANLFKGTSMSSVETLTLPTVPKDYQEGRYWVSYVEVNDEEAKNVLARFLTDEPPAQATNVSLSVEVLNGSGIQGKAQEVAERLRASGFQVKRVANADRFDYAQTRVVDHTGRGEAGSIIKVLQKGLAMSQPQEPRQVDVTVIVGRDP